jgi:hypothetical protein
MGMYPVGVHLTRRASVGVYLVGVHPTGCAPHRRVPHWACRRISGRLRLYQSTSLRKAQRIQSSLANAEPLFVLDLTVIHLRMTYQL